MLGPSKRWSGGCKSENVDFIVVAKSLAEPDLPCRTNTSIAEILIADDDSVADLKRWLLLLACQSF